jgi:hypothetical protein
MTVGMKSVRLTNMDSCVLSGHTDHAEYLF